MKRFYRDGARGRAYPSAEALARAKGIDAGKIYRDISNIYVDSRIKCYDSDTLSQDELQEMAAPGTVRRIDTGLLFPNADAAARYYGVSRQWVYACGGFDWPFGKVGTGRKEK